MVALLSLRYSGDRFIKSGEQLVCQEIPDRPQYDGLTASFSAPCSALLVVPLNYDLKAGAYLDGKNVRIWRVIRGFDLFREKSLRQKGAVVSAAWGLHPLGILFLSWEIAYRIQRSLRHRAMGPPPRKNSL